MKPNLETQVKILQVELDKYKNLLRKERKECKKYVKFFYAVATGDDLTKVSKKDKEDFDKIMEMV